MSINNVPHEDSTSVLSKIQEVFSNFIESFKTQISKITEVPSPDLEKGVLNIGYRSALTSLVLQGYEKEDIIADAKISIIVDESLQKTVKNYIGKLGKNKPQNFTIHSPNEETLQKDITSLSKDNTLKVALHIELYDKNYVFFLPNSHISANGEESDRGGYMVALD